METREEWLQRLLSRLVLYRWRSSKPEGRYWSFWKGQYAVVLDWHDFTAILIRTM